MTQLSELLDVPEWQDESQCKGVSPDVFFYETLTRGRTTVERRAEMESIAKSICAACTVRLECLEYALETKQIDGVWGGYTPKERRRIVRRQRQAS